MGDSMYIAEKSFIAEEEPHLDLDSGNWIEFQAPRGEDGKDGKSVVGPTGPRGPVGNSITGATGPKGDPGTGLKFKVFLLNTTFHIGDYVFSKSTNDTHDSMFI